MAKYQYTIQGVDYDVEINEVEGSLAKVNVNGIDFDVELKQPISVGKQMKKVKLEKPVAAPVTLSFFTISALIRLILFLAYPSLTLYLS